MIILASKRREEGGRQTGVDLEHPSPCQVHGSHRGRRVPVKLQGTPGGCSLAHKVPEPKEQPPQACGWPAWCLPLGCHHYLVSQT